MYTEISVLGNINSETIRGAEGQNTSRLTVCMHFQIWGLTAGKATRGDEKRGWKPSMNGLRRWLRGWTLWTLWTNVWLEIPAKTSLDCCSLQFAKLAKLLFNYHENLFHKIVTCVIKSFQWINSILEIIATSEDISSCQGQLSQADLSQQSIQSSFDQNIYFPSSLSMVKLL